MKFVKRPNLPENRISLAAAGNYPSVISALNEMGIRTVSFENSILPEEISRHQDMLLCHTGENRLHISLFQDIEILEKEGFSVCHPAEIGSTYPYDVKLNVAVSKDFFIYNPKTADRQLVSELEASGKKGIKTNQGYTKCSVCFVTENAAITEDESIYKALSAYGTDVLLISKGDIYLSDKHYGFFGGSTGKLDKNTLAVTGELKSHRDGQKIEEFCKKYNVSILQLTKGRIIDIGGILPLKEMR